MFFKLFNIKKTSIRGHIIIRTHKDWIQSLFFIRNIVKFPSQRHLAGIIIYIVAMQEDPLRHTHNPGHSQPFSVRLSQRPRVAEVDLGLYNAQSHRVMSTM